MSPDKHCRATLTWPTAQSFGRYPREHLYNIYDWLGILNSFHSDERVMMDLLSVHVSLMHWLRDRLSKRKIVWPDECLKFLLETAKCFWAVHLAIAINYTKVFALAAQMIE